MVDMETFSTFGPPCICRRSRLRDVDEAVVLDMGQFELPLPSLEKKTPMAQGAPNLAGMCVQFAWHQDAGYIQTAQHGLCSSLVLWA